MNLPDPLHPAIVHFPIVLLLAGLVLSVVALFVRKRAFRFATAIVFLLGALSATIAVSTGESEGEAIFLNSEAAEQLLEEHEEWAENTRLLAWLVGAAATLTALLQRWPRSASISGSLTTLLALATAYAIYQTGHRGGELVYRHAAGVNPGAMTDSFAIPTPQPTHHEEDDDD